MIHKALGPSKPSEKPSPTLPLWPFAVLFILLGLGCGEETKKQKEVAGKEDKEVAKKSGSAAGEPSTMDRTGHLLPSPLQIATILNKSGLKYENGVIHEAGDLDQYVTNTSKKLNFGIYSADLAYCVLNDRSERSLNLINAVRQLADEVGVASAFENQDLARRFEENMQDQDSLVSYLIIIQENLDDHVNKNDKPLLKTITFTGAWVEMMYIASEVTDPGENNIGPRLVEQMTILENLIESLKAHTREEPSQKTQKVLTGLERIRETYRGLDAVKKMEKDESIRFQDISLKQEEFTSLAKQIRSVRNTIIKG